MDAKYLLALIKDSLVQVENDWRANKIAGSKPIHFCYRAEQAIAKFKEGVVANMKRSSDEIERLLNAV